MCAVRLSWKYRDRFHLGLHSESVVSRRAPSSLSDGWPRRRHRCRHGSIRETESGRATADRSERASTAPNTGRRPSASSRKILERRREISCATSDKRHHLTGTRRALDAEVLAEVVMELLQRLDDEEVDREPDRPAPVRVAAEQAAGRLAWLVGDAVARRRSRSGHRAGRGALAKWRGCHTARETRARRASRSARVAADRHRESPAAAAHPCPGVCMQATFSVRSGRFSMNHSRRRLNPSCRISTPARASAPQGAESVRRASGS